MDGTARADTDTLPQLSSGELYRRAHRIEAIARVIMDCTATASTRSDPARATRLMKEIGALAGEGQAE